MPHSTRDDDILTRRASRDATGQAFLEAHHLAAATRLEQLIRRAQLAPRVTMSYNPASVGGARTGNGVETASEGAADARLRLSRLAGRLPADC